jgi:hypothetical protein
VPCRILGYRISQRSAQWYRTTDGPLFLLHLAILV